MLGQISLEDENILVKSHLEIRKSEQEGFGAKISWKNEYIKDTRQFCHNFF